MKSKLIFLFLFALLVQTVNAQVFGVKGGLNLASMSFSEEAESSVKSMLGFHAGLVAEIELQESLFFDTGVLYSTKGAKMKYGSYESSVNLNYIEVPLNIAYKHDLGDLKLFAEVGPYFGYALNGKNEYDGDSHDIDFKNDGVKRIDFGLGVGLGLELGPIVPSISYQLGLSNLDDDSEDDMTIKNKVLQISVAYMFGK